MSARIALDVIGAVAAAGAIVCFAITGNLPAVLLGIGTVCFAIADARTRIEYGL